MRNILLMLIAASACVVAQTPQKIDPFALALHTTSPITIEAAEELQKGERYKDMSIEDICASDQLEGVLIAKIFEIHIRKEQEAMLLDKLTAAQSLASIRYIIGSMYKEGDGMPQNKAEAARLFKLAADQGHSKAQFNLALMLHHGDGIPKNKTEAAKYYKLAAEQGHEDSKKILKKYGTW